MKTWALSSGHVNLISRLPTNVWMQSKHTDIRIYQYHQVLNHHSVLSVLRLILAALWSGSLRSAPFPHVRVYYVADLTLSYISLCISINEI